MIGRKDTEEEDWNTGKTKMLGTFQFGDSICDTDTNLNVYMACLSSQDLH